MNLEALEQKLMQAARSHPPGEQVPYAFEQRILARVKDARRADPVAFWNRVLWRAAFSSIAITLLASAWIALAPAPDNSLSDDFENIVYAGLNEITDSQ
jgi:anti-sigma-K factor RskA